MNAKRRATFEVATRTGTGREERRGYVLGRFAIHKERFCWTFTHLATGLSISAPWIEKKDAALAHLNHLAEYGADEHVERTLAKYPGWGGVELDAG